MILFTMTGEGICFYSLFLINHPETNTTLSYALLVIIDMIHVHAYCGGLTARIIAIIIRHGAIVKLKFSLFSLVICQQKACMEHLNRPQFTVPSSFICFTVLVLVLSTIILQSLLKPTQSHKFYRFIVQDFRFKYPRNNLGDKSCNPTYLTTIRPLIIVNQEPNYHSLAF